jgi:hypothetical protein
MRDAGFDVSFRDRPAKGGTGGHPSSGDIFKTNVEVNVVSDTILKFCRHSFFPKVIL